MDQQIQRSSYASGLLGILGGSMLSICPLVAVIAASRYHVFQGRFIEEFFMLLVIVVYLPVALSFANSVFIPLFTWYPLVVRFAVAFSLAAAELVLMIGSAILAEGNFPPPQVFFEIATIIFVFVLSAGVFAMSIQMATRWSLSPWMPDDFRPAPLSIGTIL